MEDKFAPTHWEKVLLGQESESGASELEKLDAGKLESTILAKDEDERTLFHRIAAHGNIQAIKCIIDRLGERVSSACKEADDGGWTPLLSTVSAGHEEIAKLILPFSDINAVTSAGATSIHYASSKGRLELLVALIAAGADLSLRDSSGSTPLHRSILNGKVQVTNEILKHVSGVAINRKDKSGWTSLHVAVYSGNYEVAEKLVEMGADKDVKDLDEKTPLDHAKDERMRSIVKM